MHLPYTIIRPFADSFKKEQEIIKEVKQLKNLIAVMMVLVMILTFPASSFAAEATDVLDTEVKTNREYAFTYTEYTNTDNSIIRTYRKQENTAVSALARGVSNDAASAASAEAKTKAVLASLGMSPAFINALPEEDLEEYANSPQITSMVSYTKTDADGNVVNVPEEEALAVTSVNPDPSWDNMDEPGGGYPSYSGEETDTYMRLTLVVSYKGNGLYKFSLDGEWLTMPLFRSFDMLSIYSPKTTVETQTLSGWSSFDMYTTVNMSTTKSSHKEDFARDEWDSKMYTVMNSDFDYCGAAAVFLLPSDANTQFSNIVYRNYKAHFEYEGYMHNLSDEQRFNVVGCYDHTRYILTSAPSVTIDIGLSPVGIALTFTPAGGIELEEVKDTRLVELPSSVLYTP